MNRLDNNICDTKANTADTVIELAETIKNEKPTISERITAPVGSDISTTCVVMWFVFAFAMFLIDF